MCRARLEQNMKDEPVEKIEVRTTALTISGSTLISMRFMLMMYYAVSMTAELRCGGEGTTSVRRLTGDFAAPGAPAAMAPRRAGES
jgi:hypothetical protein